MTKKKIIMVIAALLGIAATLMLAVYFLRPECRTLTEYVHGLEDSGHDRQEVVVAIIDSGYHELDGYQDRILTGYDFLEEDAEPEDTYGHGTRIASLLLANTSDEIKIMPLKVADENGLADKESVCRALAYAADKGADIINLSLNAVMDAAEENSRLNALVEELSNQGVWIIVSAGNTGADVCSLSPASAKGAIVVAAVDEGRVPYFFSGYGENVSFCSSGKYAGETGTSYSAAYVTSAAAILKMYGVNDINGILSRYAEAYDDSDKNCGKGYVWLDSFIGGGNGKQGEKETPELVMYSSRQEGDLGLDILTLDWKAMESDVLEEYLFGTTKEYVGMLLKSLSGEDRELLEEKCPALHSNVSVAECYWDEQTDSYQVGSQTDCSFAEYCISQYENHIRQMSVSDWLIRDSKIVFYISNENRTVRYRYEVSGNIENKEAGVHEDNVLGMDGSLILAAFGEEDPSFRKPQIGDRGIKTYQAATTSRWITYAGEDVDNGRIKAKEHNEFNNTLNGADNGQVFYGISIPFKGVTLSDKSGYHYAPDMIKSYRYNTTQAAVSRRYAHLTSSGWQIDQNPEIINLKAGFWEMSGILTCTDYVAKRNEAGEYIYGENTYRLCPDPTIIAREDAEQYYDITDRQVYRQTWESSFNIEKGEMTLNTEIFETSSINFYENLNNQLVYSNDIAEYVIAQNPNDYHVYLDANYGMLRDYRTGEEVNVTNVQTYYDSTDYNNLAWATPFREGYVFKGWYTGRDDGEEVWGVNGQTVNGTYWKDGVWKYSEDWSESNNNLVFYAHWEPVGYDVCIDANYGMLRDYRTGEEVNLTNVQTAYGRTDYNNLAWAVPVREGFVFNGWYTGRDDGEEVWDVNGQTVNGTYWADGVWKYKSGWSESSNSLVFYAHWIPICYQVCLDGNNGTFTDYRTGEAVHRTNVQTQYGRTDYNNLAWATPFREGYAFNGWYTGKDDGEEVWGTDGQTKNGTYWKDGVWSYRENWSGSNHNLTFYARWDPIRYTIRFDANGGTGSKPDMTGLSYGGNYELPSSEGFAYPGFRFLGWNTAADGSGDGYGSGENFCREYGKNGDIVTLYAKWKKIDLQPPEISGPPDEGLAPDSTEDHYIYDWSNSDIQLDFSATDEEMESLILYEDQGGSAVCSGMDHVSYTVSDSGIFHYTLVAKDKTGNTSTLHVTTKIDRAAPEGKMGISYDGRRMQVSLYDIVEENQEHPDNVASGCRKAWVCLQGLDEEGNVLCQEDLQLNLTTPENIYTGACYEGSFHLGTQFNYTSAYIKVTSYIIDYAGNSLPMIESETVPAFVLKADMIRCLGDAPSWKAGEAGSIHIYTAAYVDSVKVTFPDSWVALDNSLDSHIYPYAAVGRAYEKEEDDLFYIPLRAQDGGYTITVHAYKDGYEKTIEFHLNSSGSILDELRTRLR